MAKVGITMSIDVTKIDKSRLFPGEKGTYLNLQTFVDLDNKDQYDNNGFITQSLSKDERDSGKQMPILGNVKVFWSGEGQPSQRQQQNNKPAAPAYAGDDMSDDIPF